MDRVVVRSPEDRELRALAELRWNWVREKGETPMIGHDEFVVNFARWAHRNRSTHQPMITLRGRVVIGMAWLAILPRVPTPRSIERCSGDLQCVYVVPRERRQGHGGRLIAAVLELARNLGMDRVTVHSSDKAISAYERHGFDVSPRLLQTDPAAATH